MKITRPFEAPVPPVIETDVVPVGIRSLVIPRHELKRIARLYDDSPGRARYLQRYASRGRAMRRRANGKRF